MNPNQIKRLFPNASASIIAANAQDYDHSLDPAKVQDAQPQRHQASALGTAVQGKEASLRRTLVRFIGYRVKPLDPDNFAGSVKDLLDGLRHAHCITGDEPWRIRLETEQVKVAHYKDEKTEIEVIS